MTVISRLRVYLRLGRVSNLPTVWSNVIAGAWLGGARPSSASLILLAAAISLFYTGGMFLNDAFDREIDARERPERPIPAGFVSAAEVFAVGFGLLAAGEIAVLAHGLITGRGLSATIPALALAGAIVAYDVWHKQNPLSPVVMGVCRMLVYITAATAASASWSGPVVVGSLVLLAYLIGLTYAAKQEARERRPGSTHELTRLWPLVFLAAPFVFGLPALWASEMGVVSYLGLLAVVAHALSLLRGTEPGRIPRAVMELIAGISLLDALLIARMGDGRMAAIAALGFPATLFLQRFVRGT
jgi:4-hydroxybenzoate polyprenyltransferase